MAIGDEGNVKWVDGLRGISSALVVIKHITAAWFQELLSPSSTEEASPMLLQMPFFRVLIQGRIGVAGFCLVTGYVSALKPVKLFGQGNHNLAFASMSKSAIRRLPRLLIPVALIVTMAGIATQLGAFETAKHCDGYGLAVTSPNRRDNIFAALQAMIRDYVRVWTRGASEYGSELWTMVPILKGAYWIYVYLLTTAHVQQRWRMVISLIMWGYRWAANDPFFGMQFFFGAFLADLQNLEPTTFPRLQTLGSSQLLRGTTSVMLLVVGLYIGSLPDRNFDWQPWSASLRDFLAAIQSSEPDFPRFSSGLALDIIAVGLHLSPLARSILSNRFFLWLGKMSFAVYLLHNQILRSVFCWMIYGFEIPEDDKPLTVTNRFKILVLIPFYLVLTYGSAHLWTTYVDAFSARISERLVNLIKEDPNEKNDQALLPQHGRA